MGDSELECSECGRRMMRRKRSGSSSAERLPDIIVFECPCGRSLVIPESLHKSNGAITNDDQVSQAEMTIVKQRSL